MFGPIFWEEKDSQKKSPDDSPQPDPSPGKAVNQSHGRRRSPLGFLCWYLLMVIIDWFNLNCTKSHPEDSLPLWAFRIVSQKVANLKGPKWISCYFGAVNFLPDWEPQTLAHWQQCLRFQSQLSHGEAQCLQWKGAMLQIYFEFNFVILWHLYVSFAHQEPLPYSLVQSACSGQQPPDKERDV